MAVELPLEASTEELCQWWIAVGAQLNRELWQIKQRVEEYVRDQTEVVTPSGTLEAQSAGWVWDEEVIAKRYPQLIQNRRVTFSGTDDEVERALSLVTEELPTIEFSTSLAIDKRKALKMANAGGSVGEGLRQLRAPKPAKVVVR